MNYNSIAIELTKRLLKKEHFPFALVVQRHLSPMLRTFRLQSNKKTAVFFIYREHYKVSIKT
jgi:hypothetical protein